MTKFRGAMHPTQAIRFTPYWNQPSTKQIFATQPIVRRRYIFALIIATLYAAVWASCF